MKWRKEEKRRIHHTLLLLSILSTLSALSTLLLSGTSNLLGVEVLRTRLDERHDLHTSHEGAEALGDDNSLFGLVVLKDTADGTLSSAKSGVEHVYVLLFGVVGFLGTVTSLHGTSLVVGTVGARDEFSPLSKGGEPRLEIKLLGSSVVELSRNDVDDLVRKSKRLVESLSNLEHLTVHLPRLGRVGDSELLDLLELVNTEDSPSILSVRTGLLTEASRKTSVLDGELLRLNPFLSVVSRDGLLRGGDEVLLISVVSVNLVEGLVKLLELSGLSHNVLVHEERGLERGV